MPNMKKYFDTVKGIVTHTLSDGRVITLDPSILAEDIRLRCLLLGLSTTVGNAAAGRGTDIDEVYNSQVKRYEQLKSGEWRGIPNAGGGIPLGLLVEAIIRVTPNQSANTLRARLRDLDSARLTSIRQDPRIKAAIAQIRAERAEVEAANNTGPLEDLLDEIAGY
jgi:hypothetical protein